MIFSYTTIFQLTIKSVLAVTSTKHPPVLTYCKPGNFCASKISLIETDLRSVSKYCIQYPFTDLIPRYGYITSIQTITKHKMPLKHSLHQRKKKLGHRWFFKGKILKFIKMFQISQLNYAWKTLKFSPNGSISIIF